MDQKRILKDLKLSDDVAYYAGNGLSLLEDEKTFAVDLNVVMTREDESCEVNGKKSKAFGENSKTFADFCTADGISAFAGSRQFKVISGDAFVNTVTLATTVGLEPGMQCSMRLHNNYDSFGKILAVIDENVISVNGFPPRLAETETLSAKALKDGPYYYEYGIRAWTNPNNPFEDSGELNTIRVDEHPELGDLSVYSRAAHAEGYDTYAQAAFTHAEGCMTRAIGKYAHAEGYNTSAGYASHAEGEKCIAFGTRSHAEGCECYARGEGAHAEGFNCVADSGGTGHKGTHAEGGYCKALSEYSHASGLRAVAKDYNSFVWNSSEIEVSSNGIGTFNICTKDANLSGIYVNGKRLDILINKMIDDKLDPINERLENINK